MEIVIKTEPKEIAALVSQLQRRQEVGLDSIASPDDTANAIMKIIADYLDEAVADSLFLINESDLKKSQQLATHGFREAFEALGK